MSSAPTAIAKVPKVPLLQAVVYAWSCVPSLLCAAIAAWATYTAVRQSWHLGTSLAFTDFGKESMSQWLALIDICTAALPVAAVIVGKRGDKQWATRLWFVTALYVSFSMASQVGFAASERFTAVAVREEMPKAAKAARDTQLQLIKEQLTWHKGTDSKAAPPPKVQGRYTLDAYKAATAAAASARKDDLASIERLIDKAGVFDPKTVQAGVGDAQAMALSKLTFGTVSEEWIGILLSVLAAILVILAKPIFWGLAAYSWPEWGGPAAAKAAGEGAPDIETKPALAEAPAVAPITSAPDLQVPETEPDAQPNAPDLLPQERAHPDILVEVPPDAGVAARADPLPASLGVADGLSSLKPQDKKVAEVALKTLRKGREVQTVKNFLAEMTEPSASWVLATGVYELFREWHKRRDTGVGLISQALFGRYAAELGVEKEHGVFIKYRLALKPIGGVPSAAEAQAMQRAA